MTSIMQSATAARRSFALPERQAARVEAVLLPLLALLAGLLLFGLFLLAFGKSPIEFYQLVWRGGLARSFPCPIRCNVLRRCC